MVAGQTVNLLSHDSGGSTPSLPTTAQMCSKYVAATGGTP